jgi:gas vesicle protein
MTNERQEETSATTKLTYLLIGGGIGAIVALLFAPKSGHELRGDIADATRKGLEKGKETATQIGERAGEYYEVTRERAGELYSAAQEKAGELTERARGAVTQTTNPFSAALEAGRQAYSEEKRRTDTTEVAERPTYPVENKSLNAPKAGDETEG